MNVHDWSQVEDGHFHPAHSMWIAHLAEALNRGLMPANYYAMAEQSVGVKPDVIAVEMPPQADEDRGFPGGADEPSGGVAVAAAPPQARRVVHFHPAAARRRVAVREVKSGRLCSLIEIVSPGNKDARDRVDAFVGKCRASLERGVHLAFVDLVPPTPLCPDGMHPLIAGTTPEVGDGPLMAAGYRAENLLYGDHTAYLDPLDVGDPLPPTPLFLTLERYVPLPLAATYAETVDALPAFLKRQIGAA